MDEHGIIGDPFPDQGFWLAIQPTDVVEWITPIDEGEGK